MGKDGGRRWVGERDKKCIGDWEKYGRQGLFSKVCCADLSPTFSIDKSPLPGMGEGDTFYKWEFKLRL